MTQDVGQGSSTTSRTRTRKGTMYIGLGTILIIILAILVFRALSGRRA
jgi:hypothetical protein